MINQNLNAQVILGAGLSILCGVYALFNHFNTSRISKENLTARQLALINIAKHVKSESCWQEESNIPYKIGDPFITPGTDTGRIPTSCVFVIGVNQYLEVAYKNSELQVIRIFSVREVKNQLSIKEAKINNGSL